MKVPINNRASNQRLVVLALTRRCINLAKNQPSKQRMIYGINLAPVKEKPMLKKKVSILFITKKGDESP